MQLNDKTNFLEKTVTLKNGETIFYRVREGGQRNLLLLHGNMNSSVNWDVLMERIDSAFTVYAPDMRGFGESSYEKPATLIKDYARDMKLWADAVGLEKFDIVGWSFGGNVAMRMTIDHRSYVNKLILLSSGGIKGYPLEKKRFFGFLRTGEYLTTKAEIEKEVRPLERIRNRKRRKLLKMIFNRTLYVHKKPTEARYKKYEAAFFKQRNLSDVVYALSRFNISHDHNGVVDGSGEIDKIRREVLILHGEDDRVVPVNISRQTADALGQKAELRIFQQAGHAAVLDVTDTLKDAIEGFIL